MTAAGLAFIAGGLATLISFRAVLFGGGASRSERAGSSARRRRAQRSVPAPRVDAVPSRELPALSGGRLGGDTGLASIGLADDDDEDAIRRLGLDDYDPGEDEDVREMLPERFDEDRIGWEDGYLEDDSWPPRRRRREPEPDGMAWARRDAENPRGYSGRYRSLDEEKPVPDWDWPRYTDVDRPPTGDYWTPVPDDLYSVSGLDSLPPVPDYEPMTGFDLPPIPATGPMPEWPPRENRVRLPRSWAERDVQADAEERPSPRPRPATGYVSRHSAGPQ